jgi:hypothetical protein
MIVSKHVGMQGKMGRIQDGIPKISVHAPKFEARGVAVFILHTSRSGCCTGSTGEGARSIFVDWVCGAAQLLSSTQNRGIAM